MMPTFGLPITCGRCGGDLELVQSRGETGTHAVAVVACTSEQCNRQWTVEVTMREHKIPKEAARVGLATR